MTDFKAQLPPFIIAELYKNALVEIDVDTVTTSLNKNEFDTIVINDKTVEPIDDDKIYLGNNRKFISIIVAENTEKFLNDSDLKFLTSILKACQLSKDDIAIVNQLKSPVTYSYLKETLDAKYILVFGIEPTEIKLPFIIPHFQVQQYAGCTIIIAPPLTDMNKDDDEGKILKTKLWMSLQRCFNLDKPTKK